MSEYQKNEREKAIELIKNGELFENSKAGFIISRKGVNYPKEEILLNGYKNLFAPIVNQVIEYFLENKISFWKRNRRFCCREFFIYHILLSTLLLKMNLIFPQPHFHLAHKILYRLIDQAKTADR